MLQIKNLIYIFSILLLFGCASNVSYYLPGETKRVYTGLEVFVKDGIKKYHGKSAVVVTNHSGVNFHLQRNVELFQKNGINVVLLMAPEHGLYGYQNEYDTNPMLKENNLNITIHNLHKLNETSIRPLIDQCDIVIFDIQDMGMRCYTYVSNLKFIIDSLKGTNKQLIVLDRPNPIGFLDTAGPLLEKGFESKYVGALPSTLFYNMTMGETAYFYRNEYAPDVRLKVYAMSYYDRNMFYHETGLPWVPPSPNLPTYESSIIYTAVVLMEGINISIGRGTAKPFEYIGAPWIEPALFAEKLNGLGLKNFRFRPVYFEPTMREYRGEKCGGAQIFYIGGKFNPVEVSYRIIHFIMKNYWEAVWRKAGAAGDWWDVDYLVGTDKFRKAIDARLYYEEYAKLVEEGTRDFDAVREKYLIYK